MRFLLMPAAAVLALCGCDSGPPPGSNEQDLTINSASEGNEADPLPRNSTDVANDESVPAPPPGDEARPSPVPAGYRAVGNEPGWSLTIGEEQMSYIGDYGEVRITQPKPEPSIGIAGETYRTPRLDVNIVHGRCSDGMSDYVYADKVQVTADGKRVDGCGGERHLPPGASPP